MPRKARALLAYLAMHSGERVPRDRLADLLWPYQDTEQARHSLRNCLLEVRKASACAREWLGADFVHCWLTGVTLDVPRFERQHRSVDPLELREACAAYRGEFLEGFELPSEPWGEWVADMRGRLQDRVVAALTRLSELCSAGGAHDEAIAAARRLVVLDPYGERSHQLLMRALAANGRRNEAVQHYRQLEKDLRRELDVQPELETQQLAREIREGAVPAAAPPPEAWPAPRLAKQVPAAFLSARLKELSAEVRAALAGTAKLTRRLAQEVADALDAAAIECSGEGDAPVLIDPAHTPRRVAVDRAAA
jgi:DNA-binding SARP family transcriptional activator